MVKSFKYLILPNKQSKTCWSCFLALLEERSSMAGGDAKGAVPVQRSSGVLTRLPRVYSLSQNSLGISLDLNDGFPKHKVA